MLIKVYSFRFIHFDSRFPFDINFNLKAIMKNKPQNLFTLAAFCVVFGVAVSVFGQIKTGGYKTIAVEDAEVEKAANFAVDAKAYELQQEISLENISKAERQTVAGINYRLCLEIYAPSADEDEDGFTIHIQTVIFRNLKGVYKITSWEESDCGEK